MIKDAFKNLYDVIADDHKLFDFFAPQLSQFEELMTELDTQTREIRLNQESINTIQVKLKSLSVDR